MFKVGDKIVTPNSKGVKQVIDIGVMTGKLFVWEEGYEGRFITQVNTEDAKIFKGWTTFKKGDEVTHLIDGGIYTVTGQSSDTIFCEDGGFEYRFNTHDIGYI